MSPPSAARHLGLHETAEVSDAVVEWRGARIPNGRATRPSVGSPLHQSPHWETQAIPMGTVPTKHTHDTSTAPAEFKRPYYDEDQHVA